MVLVLQAEAQPNNVFAVTAPSINAVTAVYNSGNVFSKLHFSTDDIIKNVYFKLCLSSWFIVCLGQCTALFNGTECERYWEDRTKMTEN